MNQPTLFDRPIATTKTQYQDILEYMRFGHSITPLEALDRFGCLRLGARIYEMKLNGIKIKRQMIKVGNNKRVARYSL